MKILDLAATAGVVLAILSLPAHAGGSTAPAGGEPAVAVPAPVPATRPNPTANNDKDKEAAPAAAAAAEQQGSEWNAEVATPGGGLVLNDVQTEVVKKVNTYFNDLGDLKGNFVQIDANNKRMRGKFMVKRPGRFRFDYARPSRQIIISDGSYLAIQDLDLNNEDRVELDQTPFRLLLRKDVDLLRDAKIVEVQESDEQIIVALRDKSPDAPGKIKLFMSTKPSIELKEWITTDAQGLDTRIELSALEKGETLDAKLFKIEAVSLNKFHPLGHN
ncbi:outer membrane lipoprotein carrier protein LolA [Hyphomicrobium sp. CS1GBMeth3]|uniref:LolA family protein n=1 Tax=Hyphomicrobium sp. CS1GBMeth3 TaxID=1892845 RepID=UPI0009303952|nr:outer membrane lipoprotein carrier protein LolA [Hyphomicrobium sp. CS1GBMeth3]